MWGRSLAIIGRNMKSLATTSETGKKKPNTRERGRQRRPTANVDE
jgi:hypothetical protein